MSQADPTRTEELGRGELWVTPTGYILYARPGCCRHLTHLRQVKDHAMAEFFDSPEFKLCPHARSFLQADE